MSVLISPNMSLPVPVVGIEPGPEFASDINTCLSIVDAHNHAPGSGIQIDPTGININADLTFGGNNATNLRTSRYQSQTGPLADPTDLGCAYVVNNDLYFNDGLGNQVRITQNGAVAGSSGSIANLTAPASASYVSATQTFVWESDTNTPANMDCGAVVFRKVTASSAGITVQAPSSLASDYTISLPALPGAQSFMTIDASGNMAAPVAISQGITLSMLAQAVAQALNPAGTILAYGGASAPSGYLMCDGSAVSRSTYAALYAVVADSFGSGNGTTTFNVPDLRGQFLRGVQASRSVGGDPDASSRTAMASGGATGNNVGSVQGDVFKNHIHDLVLPDGSNGPNFLTGNSGNGSFSSGGSFVSREGGAETRPTNAYANFIIKT